MTTIALQHGAAQLSDRPTLMLGLLPDDLEDRVDWLSIATPGQGTFRRCEDVLGRWRVLVARTGVSRRHVTRPPLILRWT